MFVVQFSDYATKKTKKLIQRNRNNSDLIAKSLIKLKNNPFDFGLHTHKVNSKNFGFKFSSRINGDLRFIWDFNYKTQEIEVIEILDIGGHSGRDGVY